jgi:predicted permease
VRQLLVVAQIALALVLLVGSGLMLRSFQNLRGVDPGFDPTNVLTFGVSLPDAEYRSVFDAVRFHQEVTERIARLPGVAAVGSASRLPLSGNGFGMDPLMSEDHPLAPDEIPPIVHMNPVTPGFFHAMRIPLLAGRELENADAYERTGAVVVSASLANHFWPNENPIGKRVHAGMNDSPVWYTVVGIAGDLHVNSLRGESPEVIYLPMIGTSDDAWWSPLSMHYAVRTSVPPLSLAAAVRDAVWGVNPNLPIANMKTMEQIVADSTIQTEFAVLLIGIAAAVALLLGSVGLYAVVAYVVGQRVGEIGIRIALGARWQEISRLVLLQGCVVALAGVGIGLTGALGLTRLLGAMLFDVSPTDPATYAAVSLLLFAVALLASYVPARRAAAIDPVEALRAE